MFLLAGPSRQNRALPPSARLSETTNEKPVFDSSVLSELFDDSFQAVSTLLQAATDSISGDLMNIEAAIVADEASIVADAAHRLKGTSGSIFAVKLMTAASALEEIARRGSLSAAPPLVLELREAVEMTIDAIASYIGPLQTEDQAR